VKQRGRKSASAQNIVNLAVVDVRLEKPSPPEWLTPEQKQVWADVVASMRAGSFPLAINPLLSSFCTHVTSARFIEGLLRECNYKSDPKRFRALLQMQCTQSATMSMLATKLRLLPRANTRAIRHETDASGQPWNIRRPRPWESDDDEEPNPAA
jgi:hypothetical protein